MSTASCSCGLGGFNSVCLCCALRRPTLECRQRPGILGDDGVLRTSQDCLGSVYLLDHSGMPLWLWRYSIPVMRLETFVGESNGDGSASCPAQNDGVGWALKAVSSTRFCYLAETYFSIIKDLSIMNLLKKGLLLINRHTNKYFCAFVMR
ncbi:hypothetical protein LAZ67_2006295 [Cordylochernes scorpioides]|uniref:Uncharacterized protein n=1 Tax=Cordylochernes scorpioides TaxID=51811 RepID=A0ABY6K562_9ARAC|nr:hypothetical protein LAZ67_2006295 [Cordylochernes scorpioides]